MLKELIIHQIILIDHCHIHFAPGFNVLSGETGAGKSAILQALGMISGERADTTLIRKGEEKGSSQALFQVDHLPQVLHLLEEAGIDHTVGEELMIKREIQQTGKSRAFVNQQPVQIGFLKQLGEILLDCISQGASHKLLKEETHRMMLDLFGNISPLVKTFSQSFQEEKVLITQIQELKNIQSEKIQKNNAAKEALDEIEQASLEEGEEEKLFEEYTLLINQEEFLQVAEKAQKDLHDVFQRLSDLSRKLPKLKQLDPSFPSFDEIFLSLRNELKEFDHELSKRIGNFLDTSKRSDVISERLRQINALKKKYGGDVHDLLNKKKNMQELQNQIAATELEIEKKEHELETIKKTNDTLANKITSLRKKTAAQFQKELKEELATLNMLKAHLEVRVEAGVRSRFGDDRVALFLAPNKGEKLLALKECASGGELSRLLLAMQTKLSSKELISTLVFDEIDANIGGVTASMIGQKLKQLGDTHQIIAVTHFPQVAEHADKHQQIEKVEIKGRTFSQVKELNVTARKKELERMAGV